MHLTLTLPEQKVKQGWQDSPLLPLQQTVNQHKGSFGTYVVKQVLEAEGVTCKVISDKGDLDTSKGRSEVKAAFADYKGQGYQLWWNQVRPEQGGWTLLHLVGFCADKVLVWELTKEQFLSLPSELVSDGHVTGEAAGGLKQVKVRENSQTNTTQLLAPYLIAEVSADDVVLQ